MDYKAKHNNYLKALKNKKKGLSIIDSMPVRVFIATTNACNLRCSFCPNTINPKTIKTEMPWNIFEKIGNELFPFALEYHTTVNGEPFLTSYFPKIINILSKFNTGLNVTTNGMLLSQKISDLILPVLTDIKISFDGATKQTFERLRPGANFDQIIKNIRGFVKARDQYMLSQDNRTIKPTLTLQVTLSRDNLEDLPKIVEIADDLGADRVKAYLMVVYKETELPNSLWYYQEMTDKILEEAEQNAQKAEIAYKFPKKFKSQTISAQNDVDTDCHFLWQEAWIKPNGDVVTCCVLNAPVVGNIIQEPFIKIWNNQSYQRIRASINTQNSALICSNCALVNEFRKDNNWQYSDKALIQLGSYND
ncbi:MAG: radical SAM protein [Endomicrobium sp.]|jgi:radical SAM protein with 4Fe4S-binding SPASM domain|uniref:radical SAM protein n=1 Tax=Candidatus Endomicrobiellum cubanum TaxID=3242325 RepID=UPI00281D5445|nr:radical SAM protein [Endomicrobium sp.]